MESQLTQNFWTNSEDYVRNRLIFGFVGISVISLFGCFVPAKLVPVSGPALAGTHLAVIKPSGAFKSGRFYADLEEDRGFSSGECKGRWSAPAPPKPLVANDMASVWDAVYGHVYYSQLLGRRDAHEDLVLARNGGWSWMWKSARLRMDKAGKTREWA